MAIHDERLLDGLNEPQKQAVQCIDGPLMVLAGAGSGKTRVLTRRLANIVASGVPAHRVVAVTFTNKAAGEMRERLAQLIERPRELWVGTFHAIAARLLRIYGGEIGLPRDFVIYDADDQRALVRGILKEFKLAHEAKDVRAVISMLEAYRGKRLETLMGSASRLYDAYMEHLKKCNAVDFTGLIERVVELKEILGKLWDYVLVDEFQDTSRMQFAMLRAMVSPARNICVVGDDDQSIYGWRGARPEYLLQFEKEYPGARVIRLEQNYRSTGNIIAAAAALIANNQTRHAKTLWTQAEPGPPLHFCAYERERDEAAAVVSRIAQLRERVKLTEMAVLYRVNAQSRPFEEELRRLRIPYRLVGGMRFYERAEIKDVLAYLRLAVNSASDMDFLRAVKTPSRGIGAASLEKLAVQAQAQGKSLYETALDPGPELPAAARKALAGFMELMRELARQAAVLPPHQLLHLLLERTDFLGYLHSDSQEDASRRENIEELFNSMQEFAEETPGAVLRDWLDNVSLLTSDELSEGEDGVSLMTIHSAKGLEFDVVFLPGWEEGLFPLKRADEETDLEEERRLAYVAITRARREVYLSRVRRRMMYGSPLSCVPSRFLQELPRHAVQIESPPLPAFAGWRRGDEDDADDEETAAPPARARASFRESAPRPVSPVPPVRRESKETADASGFRIGCRVRHAKFGTGVVKAVVGEGEMRKAIVAFSGGESKVILTSFLQVL